MEGGCWIGLKHIAVRTLRACALTAGSSLLRKVCGHTHRGMSIRACAATARSSSRSVGQCFYDRRGSGARSTGSALRPAMEFENAGLNFEDRIVDIPPLKASSGRSRSTDPLALDGRIPTQRFWRSYDLRFHLPARAGDAHGARRICPT